MCFSFVFCSLIRNFAHKKRNDDYEIPDWHTEF